VSSHRGRESNISPDEDRLESEQLGNMDQYRATREVPLPYTLEPEADDDQLSLNHTIVQSDAR